MLGRDRRGPERIARLGELAPSSPTGAVDNSRSWTFARRHRRRGGARRTSAADRGRRWSSSGSPSRRGRSPAPRRAARLPGDREWRRAGSSPSRRETGARGLRGGGRPRRRRHRLQRAQGALSHSDSQNAAVRPLGLWSQTRRLSLASELRGCRRSRSQQGPGAPPHAPSQPPPMTTTSARCAVQRRLGEWARRLPPATASRWCAGSIRSACYRDRPMGKTLVVAEKPSVARDLAARCRILQAVEGQDAPRWRRPRHHLGGRPPGRPGAAGRLRPEAEEVALRGPADHPGRVQARPERRALGASS